VFAGSFLGFAEGALSKALALLTGIAKPFAGARPKLALHRNEMCCRHGGSQK